MLICINIKDSPHGNPQGLSQLNLQHLGRPRTQENCAEPWTYAGVDTCDGPRSSRFSSRAFLVTSVAPYLVSYRKILYSPFPVKRKGTASDWCVGFGVFQFSTKAVP